MSLLAVQVCTLHCGCNNLPGRPTRKTRRGGRVIGLCVENQARSTDSHRSAGWLPDEPGTARFASNLVGEREVIRPTVSRARKSGLFAAPCHSVSRDERHVIDRYRQQPLKFDGVGHDPKGDIGLNGSSGCVSLYSVSRHDSSNQYCANGTGSSVSKVSMRRLRTCERKPCARDQSLDSATMSTCRAERWSGTWPSEEAQEHNMLLPT